MSTLRMRWCSVVGDPRGARAVGGEHRLHVMAGGGGDEIAALLGQQPGDRLGVLAPERLAGEDDDAGVDVGGLEAGGRVGLVDDGGERRVVDALVALIGGQRHRRLVERLARDDVVAAGEVLAVAAQVDAGEDDLGAGRADVDADARERDVVLDPDRVLVERLVGIEIEMVVVVIGIAVMVVHDVLAEQVVGERMRLLAVVGVGHRSRLLAAGGNFPRAGVLWHTLPPSATRSHDDKRSFTGAPPPVHQHPGPHLPALSARRDRVRARHPPRRSGLRAVGGAAAGLGLSAISAHRKLPRAARRRRTGAHGAAGAARDRRCLRLYPQPDVSRASHLHARAGGDVPVVVRARIVRGARDLVSSPRARRRSGPARAVRGAIRGVPKAGEALDSGTF